jgi:transcription initiation factor TFIID subunit 2
LTAELQLNIKKENEPFFLAIEFCVEEPKGGVRFISAGGDQCNYLCSIDHNPHFWFPCVSSYTEPCTWKVEAIVEENMKVIASGNLIEVENVPAALANDYGLDPKKAYKRYHYFAPVPTCAPNMGLVVGCFDSDSDESISEISYFFDARLKSFVKDTCSFMSELFEFFEDILSTQFPYNTYKQVFVPDILEDHLSYASLTIFK